MQACVRCLHYTSASFHSSRGLIIYTAIFIWVLCFQSGLALISFLKMSGSCVHSASFLASSAFLAKSIHLYATDLEMSTQASFLILFINKLCASLQITPCVLNLRSKMVTWRNPWRPWRCHDWTRTRYSSNLSTFLVFSPLSFILPRLSNVSINPQTEFAFECKNLKLKSSI